MKSSHGEVTSVKLIKGLQKTALSSKACGTVVNYTSSLNRWVKFANTNKLVVFPVSMVDAALYFRHLATSQVSASVIYYSYIDYFIESATYGFLFTSCKTWENEQVSAANE